MNSLSEYIAKGYSFSFTKNLVIMRWRNYDKSEVVFSKDLAESGDDEMLFAVLERLKREISKQEVKREKRHDWKARHGVTTSVDTEDPIFI